jgi:hypothetical protein
MDSIGPIDADPDSPSRSGSWMAKLTHKKYKKRRKYHVRNSGCSLRKAGGFSHSLKKFKNKYFAIFHQKSSTSFSNCTILKFAVIKNFDLDPNSPESLGPDPDLINRYPPSRN